MPIAPDGIHLPSSIINDFHSESFDDKVKRVARTIVVVIDKAIQSSKTDAKKVSGQAWLNKLESLDVNESARLLVEKQYLNIGWTKVSVAGSGTDNRTGDQCFSFRPERPRAGNQAKKTT